MRGPRLQWYRAGYGSGGSNYGLGWCGVPEGEDKQAWNDDLQKWRREAWFEAWYQTTLEGLKKWRLSPHCWVNLHAFESEHEILLNQALKRSALPRP